MYKCNCSAFVSRSNASCDYSSTGSDWSSFVHMLRPTGRRNSNWP